MTIQIKQILPAEELRPSPTTVRLIKQIAYTCRAFKVNGAYQLYCLN